MDSSRGRNVHSNIWRLVLLTAILDVYDYLYNTVGMTHTQIKECVACYFDGGLSVWGRSLNRRKNQLIEEEDSQRIIRKLTTIARNRAYPRDKGLAILDAVWPEGEESPIVEWALIVPVLRFIQVGMDDADRQRLRQPIERVMRYEQQTAHYIWSERMVQTALIIRELWTFSH